MIATVAKKKVEKFPSVLNGTMILDESVGLRAGFGIDYLGAIHDIG